MIVPATGLGAWPSGSTSSIHPRDDFAATMTEEERAAVAAAAQWLEQLLADRVLILTGPTSGRSTPTRTWTAEDGSARSVVEVVADELGPSLRWATHLR